MKIAMITSEANPLVKTGGLADVTYSLSKELNNLGHETCIVMPFYKTIKQNKDLQIEKIGSFDVFMSWRKQYAGILKTKIENITYYFIDNEFYFNRDGIYGFEDDGERFAFFSLAVLEMMKVVKYRPDVIHVNDWQSGMIPCLLKKKYDNDEFLKGIKTVLTIHNPAFKGLLDKYYLNNFFGLSDNLFDNGSVRFDGMVSTLKAAIHYADMITTVSLTHREELLAYSTSLGFNYCLELRKDDFVGIVNGVDDVEFNPMNDKYLKSSFNSRNFLRGRSQNKKDLLQAFHLSETDKPVLGVVSRLTFQKGIDLLWPNLEPLVKQGVKVCVVGSGDKDIEEHLQRARDTYPDNIGIYIGYNNELAHKIYGGSDFFLMPSLFEPCGIGQLIAERYGSVPIVRETGGLKDTVIGYKGNNLKQSNGLTFGRYDSESLGATFNQMFDVYGDKEVMKTLITNSLNSKWSWKESALKYIDVYGRAMKK